MSDSPSLDAEYLDPVALTQRLVRFDTTNPSGNAGECIAHIKSLLDGAGIQWQQPPVGGDIVDGVLGAGARWT